MIYILILFFSIPEEEENIYHVMDMYFANFLYDWELQYDTSKIGLRTSQGCLDLENWFTLYEIKFNYMFTEWFTIFYNYEKIQNYETNIEKHTFTPSFKLYKDYFALVRLIPFYQKRNNLWGLGIMKNPYRENYYGILFRAKYLDNNFSFKDTPAGPDKILISKFPLGFEIETRTGRNNSFLYLHLEKYYESERYLDDPDTFWLTKQKEFYLYTKGNINISQFNIGTYIQYNNFDTTYFDVDTVKTDFINFREIYTEPYFQYNTEKVNFATGITFNYKKILKKEESYQRFWYAPFVKIIYKPFSFMNLHFGFQKETFDRVYNITQKEYVQKRLFTGFEFIMKNARFIVHEGIEADYLPPLKRFWFLHNHTYVSLQFTPSF